MPYCPIVSLPHVLVSCVSLLVLIFALSQTTCPRSLLPPLPPLPPSPRLPRYALSRLEHNGDVKAGQRLLQVALGGSFKAGSCAWKALRNVRERHECWAAVDAGSLAAARTQVGAPPDPREQLVWLCDRTDEEAPRNAAQSRYLYAAMRQALDETAADRAAGVPPAKALAPMPPAPSTLNTGPRQAIEF